MNNKYDDIIHLPHHVSQRHPQMSLANRAAQFAPFAALSGHDAAIAETARITSSMKSQSLDELRTLSQRLSYAIALREQAHILSVTHFVNDELKSGGRYETHTGFIKKYDEYGRLLVLSDGTKIPIDTIASITGELFSDFD